MTENVGVIFFGLGAFIAIFMLGLCLLFFLMAVIPYYGKIRERRKSVFSRWVPFTNIHPLFGPSKSDKRLNEVLGMWATT